MARATVQRARGEEGEAMEMNETKHGVSINLDDDNMIYIRKSFDSNQSQAVRIASGVHNRVNIQMSTGDWFHVLVSWSVREDEFRVIIDGGQIGPKQTGLESVDADGDVIITKHHDSAIGINQLSIWDRPVDEDLLRLASSFD